MLSCRKVYNSLIFNIYRAYIIIVRLNCKFNLKINIMQAIQLN